MISMSCIKWNQMIILSKLIFKIWSWLKMFRGQMKPTPKQSDNSFKAKRTSKSQLTSKKTLPSLPWKKSHKCTKKQSKSYSKKINSMMLKRKDMRLRNKFLMIFSQNIRSIKITSKDIQDHHLDLILKIILSIFNFGLSKIPFSLFIQNTSICSQKLLLQFIQRN